MMEYINDVTLYGEIIRELEYSHEYDGVPFYSVDLKLISAKNSKKGYPVVRCYFSGDQLTSSNINTGVLLKITGKLINSKIKGLIDISVLINTYELLKEITDDMDNQVVLSGEVTKIFTSPDNYKGFINFVVAELDEEGKRKFSSRVVIWNRLGDYVFKNTSIGDHVMIKGTINNSMAKSKPEDGNEVEEVMVSEVLGTYFTKLTEDQKSED